MFTVAVFSLKDILQLLSEYIIPPTCTLDPLWLAMLLLVNVTLAFAIIVRVYNATDV